MGKQIEAEMLEIIEKSREEWSHDVTDHTENEYIREGLLNAGYRKQEWISVEERLPEKNYHDFVLAWNGIHVEFLHYSHRYKQWEDYYSLKEHPWKVTHWMPLPEAPKGVVDGKAD
jgi:hypothetical protein